MCREFPPAAYPPGGIGTYVRHITRLLAEAGETVHVIAHRWAGAPHGREVLIDGRLIIHRIAMNEAATGHGVDAHGDRRVSQGLLASAFPVQAFAWHAARLAERLIATEGIDVIEAQEWEAPLYYLQLRRRLGLGPDRTPPCVVHLHSSTEQIYAANHWDTTVADYAPAAAHEAFSITAADALMAPSQFIAQQALTRYGVDPARVHVVPYPIGNAAPVTRADAIWGRLSICHVGRLEPRKGVLEWVDAVVSVVADDPDLRIDFVGGDTPLAVTGGASVGAALRARIPARSRHQFRFHGSRDPAGVAALLAQASAVVVPSRWENFPYSCIEAMAAGLPAIVSPNGGMRELVEDGVCGWVAVDGTPAGLAAALRRALDTPAGERRRMGQAAADRVNGQCANASIVRQHLALKQQLAQQSAQVPSVAAVAPRQPGATGRIGVVVLGLAGPAQLAGVRRGLRAQSEAPAWVVVLCADLAADTIAQIRAQGWEAQACGPAGMAWASRPDALALLWVDAGVQLAPEALRSCRLAFAREDTLAVWSAWVLETAPAERVRVQADPTRPDLLDAGTPAPLVAIRISALSAVDPEMNIDSEQSRRSLTDRLLASGYSALTYPAVLGSMAPVAPRSPRGAVRYSSMTRAVQRMHTPLRQWLLEASPEERRQLLVEALRNPLLSLRWMARRALYALRQWLRPQQPSRGAASTTVRNR